MNRFRGELRPLPANPRYLTHDGTTPIVLAGTHTWANFATDTGDARFDYPAYLDRLDAWGHNFFRAWNWDLPFGDQGPNGGPFRFGPPPFERTGPGEATDGLPRFDLTRFHEPFFARVRERVELARERDMYCAVMLFQGFAWQWGRSDRDGHFYDGRNNVNGVDVGPGEGAATLDHPDAVAIQEAFAKKMIDTLNDLDNVMYEISNESSGASTAWQYHHIDRLHEYLATRPHRQLVGMTYCFEGGTNDELHASPADWISPDQDEATRIEAPVADGAKIIVSDTDHGYDWRSLRRDGPTGWQDWAWRCATRGHHTLFMDPWTSRITLGGTVRNAPLGVDPADHRMGLAPDPFWDPIRVVLGATRRVLAGFGLGLAAMTPRPELASSRYCVADPGVAYLVFQPEDGPVELDLPTGRYEVARLDPADGRELARARLDAVGGPFPLDGIGSGRLVARVSRVD